MENQQHKPFGLIIGMATLMSALFLLTPPFEKNPQQCEMVQTIGKKNQETEEKPAPEG